MRVIAPGTFGGGEAAGMSDQIVQVCGEGSEMGTFTHTTTIHTSISHFDDVTSLIFVADPRDP